MSVTISRPKVRYAALKVKGVRGRPWAVFDFFSWNGGANVVVGRYKTQGEAELKASQLNRGVTTVTSARAASKRQPAYVQGRLGELL